MSIRKCLRAIILTLLLTAGTCFAQSNQLRVPHVTVTWCTLDSAHAQALAQTMAAAREIYVGWGFNMPKTVGLSVTCGDGVSTRLFNDGMDKVFLSIPSLHALAPPAQSGVFNIYGLCHEMGHLAMYRTLRSRDWLRAPAAEGWAHYIGSVVVDRVFAAKGESLWPKLYDYRQDGTARLEKDIASKSPGAMAMAAAQWQKLGAIIGLRAFPGLFAAWQQAGIDPVRPSGALITVLDKLHPKDRAALDDWWRGAEPILVENLRVSKFPVQQISPAKLSGRALKLPPNGGTETSHMSIGGGGEGRKFTVPSAGAWYITTVWIYGSRYGAEKPPDTKFDIALSDADAKLISIWKDRYASFAYGRDAWARFDVPHTRVPPTFYITLNFHADASNGVLVGFDSATKGSSIDSIPGKPPHQFNSGDWMIRVELSHEK